MTTGYGLDERGVALPVLLRIFTSPYCPERLWGSLSVISKEYWLLFPRGHKIIIIKKRTIIVVKSNQEAYQI
jgi:hypothetical protein